MTAVDGERDGSIVPPVIVVDGLDVKLFDELPAAEEWMEPWQVAKPGEARYFDALGHILEATVVDNRVLLRRAASGETDPGGLAELYASIWWRPAGWKPPVMKKPWVDCLDC